MVKEILNKISSLSLRNLWDFLFHNWKFRIAVNPAPEFEPDDFLTYLFPEVNKQTVKEYKSQLLQNSKFLTDVNTAMAQKRNRWASWDKWQILMYIIVRLKKPDIMVETGVFDGQSSAVILQAMEDNAKGLLVSVDYPAYCVIEGSTNSMKENCLPKGCEPGWIIPEYLKNRHKLLIGDSKKLLPKLFGQYPLIDIFFHDSLHTFRHQYFEYKTSWPYIKEGGLLLSDDISWSFAFHKFCRENKKSYIKLQGEGFGAALK